MKFSVIIPTYKGYDSIDVAIQSVLKQKYDDFEIIVSDDNSIGSEEQLLTEKCVNSYNNPKIKYLNNGHKNGSAARNAGIKEASGDIVSLLDDDDFYLKDYFKVANDYFINHPDVELLFFDVNIITQEGISRKITCPTITPIGLLFSEQEIGTGSNLCFRKSTNKVLFDERYMRHQDIEFAVKKMSKCKYHWIQEAKIVKNYNKTNNFPKVELALEMQQLLREDMKANNIINEVEYAELKKKQIVLLYNDLLIRKAPLQEIKKIQQQLKDVNCYTLTRKIMYFIYSISKSLFCVIAKLFIRNNQNQLSSKEVQQLLGYKGYCSQK